MWQFVAIAAAALIIFYVLYRRNNMFNPIPQLKVRELQDWLNDTESDMPTILEVRELNELQETGTIPGAVHIPLGKLTLEALKAAGISPQTTLVVSCRSGARSMQACLALRDFGYKNVYNLLGGILDWRKSGAEIEEVS
jgi:rhodanese-related sulfurtransferase